MRRNSSVLCVWPRRASRDSDKDIGDSRSSILKGNYTFDIRDSKLFLKHDVGEYASALRIIDDKILDDDS